MLKPDRAEEGFLELVLAGRENVLVELGQDGQPGCEAEVVQLLLDIGDGQDACDVLREYAHSAGLPVTFFLGESAVIVKLG